MVKVLFLSSKPIIIPGDTPLPVPCNLPNLLKQTEQITEWRDLGLWLKVPVGTLDTIEQNRGGDVKRCKEKVLDYWIKNDMTASWETLANAIESMGGNTVLVQEIRMNCCKKGILLLSNKTVCCMWYHLLHCHQMLLGLPVQLSPTLPNLPQRSLKKTPKRSHQNRPSLQEKSLQMLLALLVQLSPTLLYLSLKKTPKRSHQNSPNLQETNQLLKNLKYPRIHKHRSLNQLLPLL